MPATCSLSMSALALHQSGQVQALGSSTRVQKLLRTRVQKLLRLLLHGMLKSDDWLQAVEKDYYFQMYLDDLPVSCACLSV